MRALALDFAGRNLEIAEVPDVSDGEVLFRVFECGICGTDRELASFALGRPPVGSNRLVLGHEAVGIVERSIYPGIAPGDVVVPSVRRACATVCSSCVRGRRDLCLTGTYNERGIFGLDGYCAEWAADRGEDLFVVPRPLLEVAVLVEPLSVVEKAIEKAEALFEGSIRSVLVLGAGAVGILTAYAALLRGWSVTVLSREAEDAPRVRLLRSTGVRYVRSLEGIQVDVVIEACGSGALAAAALTALAPLGVLVLVGARGATVEMPFLDLIVGNRIIAGSVNACPEHFRRAVTDLGAFDIDWITPLLVRQGWETAVDSVRRPPRDAVKTVLRLH